MPASSAEGISGVAAALESTFRQLNSTPSHIKTKKFSTTSANSDSEEDDFADAWEEGLINHEVCLLKTCQLQYS